MGGRHPLEKSGKKNVRFSAASPMMIFPPLLLVFSTDSAVLRPCSCFPRPWPSLKPYFCMILWATVPLCENCSGVTKHTAQACTEFFHETITNYTCCVCVCVYVAPTPCLPGKSWLVLAVNVAGLSRQTSVEGWQLSDLWLDELHPHRRKRLSLQVR